MKDLILSQYSIAQRDVDIKDPELFAMICRAVYERLQKIKHDPIMIEFKGLSIDLHLDIHATDEHIFEIAKHIYLHIESENKTGESRYTIYQDLILNNVD